MLGSGASTSHTHVVASRLRLLAVCTHNRTRSVLMAALFQQHAEARGVPVAVRSAGTGADGEPPTDTTVRMLAAREIDVTQHYSAAISDSSVGGAHLIVTAEQAHVVSIAGRWPDSFHRTFTLPELVARGTAVGPISDHSIDEWLAAVNHGRLHGLDYLDTPVGEIDDPTGRAPAVWAASFQRIDDLTDRLATLLA
jgi:protein-tyrosine-phosphatase